jgi:diguanylate cyclase (GGDEF)-like protein/PAS domain S-box-containing protein
MDSSIIQLLNSDPFGLVVSMLFGSLATFAFCRLYRPSRHMAGMAHNRNSMSAKLILRRSGHIVYANQQACELLPIEASKRHWSFKPKSLGRELSKAVFDQQACEQNGYIWNSKLCPELKHILLYSRKGRYLGKPCHFINLYQDTHRAYEIERLSAELQSFTDAFNSLPNLVHFKDLNGHIIGCNRSWANAYGLTPEGIKGKCLADVATREELAAEELLDQGVMEGHVAQRQGWVNMLGGEQRLLEMNSYPLLNKRQELQGVMSISTDVTNWHNLNRKLEQENQQRIATEQMLEKQNSLIRTVFNSSSDPIGFFDKMGYLTGGNQPFAEMFGLTQDELIGRRVQDVLTDGQGERHWVENQAILATGEDKCYEELVVFEDGRQIWYEVRKGSYLDDSSGASGIILVARDVSERKQTEQQLADAIMQLQELSFVDALTQVANRRSFDEKMSQLWLTHRRDKSELGLILIDIDCFKQYNDNYGHQSGDHALRSVASIISKTMKRSSDLVARYGGEEFAILLPSTDISGASRVAQELLEAIESAQIDHHFSEAARYLTISVGVASIIPDPKADYGDLVQAADIALYRAKRGGRNRYCVAYPEDALLQISTMSAATQA